MQWITGPAGSGKTWLLEQKVVVLARNMKGGKILVLCFNRPLCQYLEKQFWSYHSVIDVLTYSRFLSMWRRYGLPCYQHIFVDEGQDLGDGNWFEGIKHFLQSNDGNPHYLWVMYDSNQNVRPSEGNLHPSIQQEVSNAHQLKIVVRNPRNIFEISKKYYSAIDGVEPGHNGPVGLNIVWDNSLRRGGTMLVVKHVGRLHKQVQMKDICVLCEDVPKRDLLTAELRKRDIACQDAEEHIQTEQHIQTEEHIQTENQAVIVESIRRFKGLESKVVILFDPPYLQTPRNLYIHVKELLYTAVSRCFCLLVIISTEEGCEALQSELGYIHEGNSESEAEDEEFMC